MQSSTAVRVVCVVSACGMLLGLARPSHAQAIRTWSGASAGAWLTTSNWTPSGTFSGTAPLANPSGEGSATDIFSIAAANTASSIGINMNTLNASGGVGLIMGGMDVNKTNTTSVQIFNSSSTAIGTVQLNGATINSVANTLIRLSGSANLTLAGFSTGTLGLRLGNTNGIFDVASGRNLTLSGTISEPAATPSGFTKTSSGTLTLNSSNLFSGTVTLSAGVLALNSSSALGSGTLSLGSGANQVRLSTADMTISRPATVTGGGGGTISQGLFHYSAGSGTGTWSGNITVNGSPTSGGLFGSASGGQLVVSGNITSGSSPVSIRTGTVTLSGTGNDFPLLHVSEGSARVGDSNAIPSTARVDIGNSLTLTSNFDVNGYSPSFRVLTASGSTATVTNGGASASTITLTGSTYNSIPNTVISRSGTGTMTIGGGAGILGVTFNTGADTPVIDNAVGLVITSTLTSANGFTKIGAGAVALSANNASTLAGTVTGSAGTLIARTAGSLGSGTVSLAGATLQFETNNGTYATAIETATATQINANNVAVTLSGPITIAGDVTFRGQGGSNNQFTLNNANAITSLNNSSVTFNVDSTQNHAVSGIISTGTGAVSKLSSATLTLSNAGNSFSGGLNQRGSGGITISAAGAQGSGPITFGPGGSGAITFSNVAGTVANDILDNGGGGGITKSGTGSTLTLSGSNTYTGATTISGGYIRVTNASALSATGTVSLTASSGNPGGLQLEPGVAVNRLIQTAGRSNATTTGYILRSLGGSTEWQGTIAVNATGGNYGFVSDSGTMTLSGTLTSTATGAFGSRTFLFAGDGDFIVSGNIVKGGTLAVQNLSIDKQGVGTLTLSGTNDYSGGTNVVSGTLRAGHASAFGTGTVTVNGGTLDLAGFSVTNALTGSQGFITNASAYAGTQTVSGPISYAGTVGGMVDVATGGLLAGNAVTFTGPVSVSGTHSPGASPGLQTFNGGLGYTSAATLVWELSANTEATADRGVLYDAVDVTTSGSLSVDPLASISLVFNAPLADTTASTVDWSNSFWDSARQWKVVDVVAPATWNSVTFGNVLVGNDATGASLSSSRPSASFTVGQQSGDMYVFYVPEPRAALPAIAAALGAWLLRRRRIL